MFNSGNGKNMIYYAQMSYMIDIFEQPGHWSTVLSALAANIGFCLLWIWSFRRIYLSSDNGRAMAWGLVLTMFFPQQSI